ncbi:MAG: hypothetical protein RR209_04295 [Angelakisella sp.]
MIAENLLDVSFPPPLCADFAIKIGARVSGGTDMSRLMQGLEQKFKIKCVMSNKISQLIAHLRGGGVAVINVGGDRPGYRGIFSNGGHYIVAIAMENGKIALLDPGLYRTKYHAHYRAAVTVRKNILLASPEIIDQDAQNRNPRYYLCGIK